MPNHLAAQSDSCDLETVSVWSHVPDNLLLMIFSYLEPSDLLTASEVCKQWNCVGLDDLLWKQVFYRYWKIDRTIDRAPGKTSWLSEFKRLYWRTPMVESEVIQEHRDQVLHVAFSHNGKLISSCSKDGFVKVWNSSYPVSLKYYADMKELTWKYTQLSQFNESDTHLLVSGVHFGSNSTSGEIVVFNMTGDKFELQCRVLNKPYDVFGAWYNNDYLLSGNIHWQGNFTSCSVLWLNKASQALESEHESVVMCLFKFLNINASSVRTIMMANCLDSGPCQECAAQSSKTQTVECSQIEPKGEKPARKVQLFCDGEGRPVQFLEVDDHLTDQALTLGTIKYAEGYRQAEVYDVTSSQNVDVDSKPSLQCDYQNDHCQDQASLDNGDSGNLQNFCDYQQNTANICEDAVSRSSSNSVRSSSSSSSFSASNITPSTSTSGLCSACKCNALNGLRDKYLVFTMGTKTYTPHQIGIKRITGVQAAQYIEAMRYRRDEAMLRRGPRLPERHAEGLEEGIQLVNMEAEYQEEMANQIGANNDEKYDSVDHLIELHGHIIGMCLSPDHRYLYVNSRPWPKDYFIDDPLYPPPIAQEIDIHVIDLLTMNEVGTMHRSHKAYTPNDECFFIFLDVCKEYVASGAENKSGYLWDRHYGVCVATYPHTDVVNCVAFNPCDQEMLVTASDDKTLKIWRSRRREKQLHKKKTNK